MQSFIFGLMLACVTGITAVAFKHPKGFAKLFPYLFGLATSVFAGLSIWHVAVELTSTSLMPYVAADFISAARSETERWVLPYAWVGIWYLGFIALLYVNLKLPTFLKIAEDNDVPQKNETMTRNRSGGNRQKNALK